MLSSWKQPNHFQRSMVFGVPQLSNKEKGLAFFSHCNKPPSSPPPMPPTPPPISTIPPPPPPLSPPPPPPPTPPISTTFATTLPPHFHNLDLVVLVAYVSDLFLLVPEAMISGADLVFRPEMMDTSGIPLVLQPVGVDPFWGFEPNVKPPPVGYTVPAGFCLDGEVGFLLVNAICWIRATVESGLEKWVGLECVFGSTDVGLKFAGGLDTSQLNSPLSMPRRPPDPSSIATRSLFSLLTWSQVISKNLLRPSEILYPHEAQCQALRDLVFCPPTDDPILDRSFVALDAWGFYHLLVADWYQRRGGVDIW